MIAVISDIHSNMEALTAVLDDIAGRDVARIVCLGDVVGYGPQPGECLDIVKDKAEFTLLGNHDYAVLYEPSKFNIGAETACYWTRQQLEDEPDKACRDARWDFLGGLQMKHTLSAEESESVEFVLFHGSPRRPINEYIFPDDIFNAPSKITGLFERFKNICLVGHTHVPGVFMETLDFYSPDELDFEYEINPTHKALVNVGSVGQPRDRDPRASYALIDPDVIRFIRVKYDVEAVVKKVLDIQDLDDYLGIRLREGR